jgi:hypothetical protein
MPFPVNGVLDDFNRANQGPPPSANWTNLYTTSYPGTVSVVSNEAASTAAWAAIYWNPVQFGPDCEAYYNLRTAGIEKYVLARIQSPGSAANDGYAIKWSSTGVISIVRIDNDSYTQLGASSSGHTQVIGDWLGIEIIGNTINSWRFQSAAWTNDLSQSDATYPGAGYIGYVSSPFADNFDDFSGGTLAGGGPTNPFMSSTIVI